VKSDEKGKLGMEGQCREMYKSLVAEADEGKE